MRIPIIAVLLLALVLVLLAAPRETAAQALRAATGGAVGIAGGAVITLSVVVARAHFQGEYLESADDLIHWQSAPMLITPAVGVMFGLAGREPFLASVKGSTGGMLIGTALGAGIGWLISGSPEHPWAGGVIGAGAGMTIGGLYLGLRAWARQEDDDPGGETPLYVGVRIPL